MSRLTPKGREKGWANKVPVGKVLDKLAHYEDLEEDLEKLFDGRMSIETLVNNFIKTVRKVDGHLDFARILTNKEAEDWVRWRTLNYEGRLIELPCKVGDAVYEILPPCNDTQLCKIFAGFRISRCVNKECGHYIQVTQFAIEKINDLGKTVFLTKAEAEAKLKLLQTLPILHGNTAPISKEEAMKRFGLKDKMEDLKGE